MAYSYTEPTISHTIKLRKPFRILRNLVLFLSISSIGAVIFYRFVSVYVTLLMIIRSVQQLTSGEEVIYKHTWVPLNKISPSLPMAVIAPEDNHFASHNGFDTIEIKKAMKENEIRKKKRGASTISQQTAKNVFLWPQSSWIGKGFEVYFTSPIERCWSEEWIMEVYLNSIEMGRGTYGAQATAKYKFKTTATKLIRGQCVLIAATLPNSIRFDSAHPSPYIKRRQGRILRLMNLVPKSPFADKKKEQGKDTKSPQNEKKKK